MNDLLIYCLCLNDNLLSKVKNLNYKPVGVGKSNFSNEWLRDNTKINISKKNPYYGEYSFHYWLWKNHLDNIVDGTWIGFCTYRRFWNQKKERKNDTIFDIFGDSLKQVPKEWTDFDTILANKIDLTNLKWMKVLKYGKLAIIKKSKSYL